MATHKTKENFKKMFWFMLEVATMEFLPYVIGKNKFHPHLYVQSKQIVTKWDEDSSGWLLLEPVSIWSDTVQDYADFLLLSSKFPNHLLWDTGYLKTGKRGHKEPVFT